MLLWKTVKDFAELAKVSKLQTEVRFRPWVGPNGGFELLREDGQKKQYSITMKNFGEVPASNVIVTCTNTDSMPDKTSPVDNSKGNGNNQFQIGPLLPGMEKRYWVFIENERYRKTMEGASCPPPSLPEHGHPTLASAPARKCYDKRAEQPLATEKRRLTRATGIPTQPRVVETTILLTASRQR